MSGLRSELFCLCFKNNRTVKIPVARFALSHEQSCNSDSRLNETQNIELILLTNEIKVDPLSCQGIRRYLLHVLPCLMNHVVTLTAG